MKNYIGTAIPQKYYIGDTRVYKLYKGASLLWDSEVPSGVTVTYYVTSTTSPTQIARDLTGFTKMSVDGGTPIAPSSSYVFSSTGEHTVVWDLVEPVVPYRGFMYSGSSLPILYVEIGDGVIEIGDYAFFRTTMTGVTIPDTVTKIGEWAFTSNQDLGSVSLPSGLTTIGTSAFNNCRNIKQITIPESVEEIGGTAFSQTGIRTINIPGKVMNLNNTFSWCADLHTVTFSQSDRYYLSMNYAFKNCGSLTSVTTPSDCQTYCYGSFSNCESLQFVSIPNTYQLEDYMFTGSTALTSVTFPDYVDMVGGYNFKGCASLTSVTIPNSVYCSQAVIDNA